MLRLRAALLCVVCVAPLALPAQSVARPGRVRGIVVDSLLGAYLADARVTLTPGGRSTVTDSAGRFAFDSVAAGEWQLSFRHAALDSIRVVPASLAIRVFGGATTSVALATPSFERVRAPICHDTPDSLSHTVASGRVSAADGVRLKIDVGVSWLSAADTARHGTVRTLAGDDGQFWTACGIPWGAWIHAFVRDSSRMASAYLQMGERGVAVRDLLIAAGTRRVRGVVEDDDGRPVPGARVLVIGSGAFAVADAAGRFELRDVPAGTVTLDARAAGHSPQLVTSSDTTTVVVRMPPLYEPTEGEPRGSDYLRLIERSTIRGVALQAGSSLLAESTLADVIPSPTCGFWLDGRPTTREFFLAQPKWSWRAVELYVNGADAPPEYRRAGCPVVLLWTAAADW